MPKPKFRLFGGPNGSGKTHVFNTFREKGIIHTETYVSADRIEADLNAHRTFWFNAYRVKVDEENFKLHILQSTLFREKIADKSFIENFTIKGGVLRIGKRVKINSYHASFIASFLVEALFQTGQSFAFETVMSHESKVKLLKQAQELGYKTYLYFIFTDTLSTNVARVQLRVLLGGHNVPETTILNRAPLVFENLPGAFEYANNAYVIDNSGEEAAAILIKEGATVIRARRYPNIIKAAVKEILRNLPDTYTIKTE